MIEKAEKPKALRATTACGNRDQHEGDPQRSQERYHCCGVFFVLLLRLIAKPRGGLARSG
jgi:hypothetical protein